MPTLARSEAPAKLATIKAALIAAVPPVKFVAVDGHGGSGKSTLAAKLASELGAEAIHTDDFASPEHPIDWWPLLVERVFKPIEQGAKTLSYPRSKWWENHHPEPVVDQPVTPIMIVEGITSSRSEFRPYLTYKIWIETPTEICFARGVGRDRQQGTLEAVEKMWENWLDGENRYIERDQPIENADIIVDGTKML